MDYQQQRTGIQICDNDELDGQHYPANIPAFVNEIEMHPDSMLVGQEI